MWDAVSYIVVQIFDYFFAQNAPMTVMLIGLGAANFMYLSQREKHILVPLKVEKAQSELIKRQMDMAEYPLEKLHSKLFGLYRHERRMALEAQGMSTTEARDHLEMDMHTFMHSLQLWGVHGVIRSKVRQFFKENHLADKDDNEFKVYLERRKKDVWNAIVQAMNEYWFGGMTAPSRSDMYDCHEKNQDDIMRILEEIFIEGRVMAIKYQAGLKKSGFRLWGFL
jgi:hypothetical protein